MNINIVLPYCDAEKHYKRWASSENEIDFEKNSFEAMRCTASFACCELVEHFEKIGHTVSYGCIKLKLLRLLYRPDTYRLFL